VDKTLSFSINQLAPGITSALISILLVVTTKWHGKHSLDSMHGVQKIHCSPTPRIGGLAVFFGFIVAWFMSSKSVSQLFGSILISGLFAFFAGLTEDITKRVSVRIRLFATMISGAVGCLLTGYSLNHMNIVGLDLLLTYLPISIVFT